MAAPTVYIEDMRSFICEECGKKLSTPSSLSRHRRCHQEKTQQCAVCDKGFTSKEHLKQHLISHSTEPQNTCAKCGNQFKHRQSLERHVKGHMGGKPRAQRPADKQKCQNCGKEFFHLRKHMILCKEGRQRTFECRVCGRKFLEQRYLNEHTRCVHSFEERYTCPICNDKFHYRASLLNHKRRRH